MSPVVDNNDQQPSSKPAATVNLNLNLANNSRRLSLNNNNNNENNCSGSNNNNVAADVMDVPWDMPKLRRRMQNSTGNLNNRLQRSDSGISTASQVS